MKKSELSVVIFMLGFCAFFFYETLQLPPAAQSYPKFVIGLLAVLTLMQLVKMACSCHGHFTIVNDLPEVWTHFLPRQFFTFLITSILFFVLMVLIGFYPSAILYLLFMLHFFHPGGAHGPDLYCLQRIPVRASAGRPAAGRTALGKGG